MPVVRPRQKLGEQETQSQKKKRKGKGKGKKRARMQGSRSKKCPDRGLSNTLPSWAVNRPGPSRGGPLAPAQAF